MTSSEFLGFYAADDEPKGNKNGIYRVAGQGWFARVYGQHYGYFATESAARQCLDEMIARGPSSFYIALRVGLKLLKLTTIAALGLFVCLACCAMVMCL